MTVWQMVPVVPGAQSHLKVFIPVLRQVAAFWQGLLWHGSMLVSHLVPVVDFFIKRMLVSVR